MATLGERVATLEVLAADNARRIAELHDDIHSGPTVEWGQSIRGRLHKMSAAIDAADKLADAARELAAQQERTRQAEQQTRSRRLTRWQWFYLAVCATAAAVAPYVLHFAG